VPRLPRAAAPVGGVGGHTGGVRISAKSDYAVRAMAELAVAPTGHAVKAESIAEAQEIPLNFLLGILRELRNAHLVRSQRGREGGYVLSKPAKDIALADVIRAVDGPLANVRDLSLQDLSYPGAATALRDVWMAVRGSLREVLEQVSVADLANDRLPASVRRLAEKHAGERYG
jgi:Rrf2 family protein